MVGAVTDATPEVRQQAVAAAIEAHRNDPPMREIINRVLDIANPLAISANASIDALAPLVLVAGNEEAKILLANILVDARVPAVAPADRGAALDQELDRINNIYRGVFNPLRDEGPIPAIKAALAHNRVEGLAVLRMMHDKLVDPSADPELLLAFVNANNIPRVADEIIALCPAGTALPITAAKIKTARENNPADFEIIMQNALAIADPAAVADALNSDPLIRAASKSGTADCVENLTKTSNAIEVDPAARRLSEVQKNADNAGVLMNPAATIAARKMVIGTLARIVNNVPTDPRNADQELARAAVIREMDFNVLAGLVVADNNIDRKREIARWITNPPAVDIDAALIMLNDSSQAKRALEVTLQNQHNPHLRGIGNAIRDVLIHTSPNPHVAMERVLGTDPVGLLAKVRVGHGQIVTAAITPEVTKLSAADIREIAKVDLTVCAVILANIDNGIRPDPLLDIAKWVPVIPPQTTQNVVDRLRNPATPLMERVAELRTALIAHPVEFQTAINKLISDVRVVPDRQLKNPGPPVVILVAIRNEIERNPSAAIDAHPTVIKARNNFVAKVPTVVAAKFALDAALLTARTNAVNRSNDVTVRRGAVEQALKDVLANNMGTQYLANAIVKNDVLRQAVGSFLPPSTDSMAVQLKAVKLELLVEIFTNPVVANQFMYIDSPVVPPNPDFGFADLQDAVRQYVPKNARSIEAAVERTPEVIQARMALETTRRATLDDPARLAAFNNDPKVKQARADVVQGAQQSLVQEKFSEHLRLGKTFTGKPTTKVIQTLEFTQDGEPPIVVSADKARDTILQLIQDDVKYFTDLVHDQDRLLGHAEKCKTKTEKADKSLVPKTKAIEDLESVLNVLKDVKLTDKEKTRVERAENLLKSLRSKKDPVGRLFDETVKTEAENEVTRTDKAVKDLAKELKEERDELPERTIQLAAVDQADAAAVAAVGGMGVINAARAIVGNPVNLSNAMIRGAALLPAAVSSVEAARMEAYMNLIKNVRAVKTALDANPQNVAVIDAAIADARHKLGGAQVQEVREEAIKRNPDVNAAITNGDKLAEQAARARIDQGVIDNDRAVVAAVNKFLDQKIDPKVWQTVVAQDATVRGLETRLETAQGKAQEAVTSRDKIVSQFSSKKEAMMNLNAGRNKVKKVKQHEATKLAETIEARKERAVEMKKEAREATLYGRAKTALFGASP